MTRILAALGGLKTPALVAAVCLALGFAGGWIVRDWKASADRAAARISAAEAREAAVRDALYLERKHAAVSHAAEVAAIAAQVEIRTVTKTLIERIPVYVPAEADVRFALPDGLVRLHDAAAGGLPLPDPAADPDGAAGFLEPSAAAPSRLGAVIVENYGVCHADAARFAALQKWIRDQAAVMNRP